ncbi:MAG TPA: STAS/SEC14 domain-containing protein, partial [Flavobacterium sp.]|nr:STAS/SEC14 domain-containing protein [Flavobacterium sp.]
TQADFENVIFPTVEQKVKVFKELNYLLYLNTEIKDFTFKAWLQDLLLGIKNLTKWNRCAIVTDNNNVQNFTEIFSILMPGEFRSFSKDNLESAVFWCANGKDKNN